MKVLHFLFVFLTVALCHTDGQIRELSHNDLRQVVRQYEFVMVKFYATWCGHCQEMNPAYERLASHFSNNRRVLIAQVNAPDNQGVHHQYGIRGYPTLKIFDHGNLEDAHCGRDFDSMKNLIESKLRKMTDNQDQKQLGPLQLTDDNFYDIVKSPSKEVLVEFFAPWCPHCQEFAPTYERVANAYDQSNNVIIAQVNCDEFSSICNNNNIQGYPTIKIFMESEKGVEYDGMRDYDSIIKFVDSHVESDSGSDSKSYGTDPYMDKRVKEFFSHPNDREGILEKIGEKARKKKDFPSIYYAKTLEKLEAHGSDFIGRELNRLNELLKSKSIEKGKVNEIRMRRNILARIAKIGKINVDDKTGKTG